MCVFVTKFSETESKCLNSREIDGMIRAVTYTQLLTEIRSFLWENCDAEIDIKDQ